MQFKRFAVEAIWRNDQAVGDATVQNVVEGVSRLFGGPEQPGKSITFPVVKLAQNRCAELPVRVPANTLLDRRAQAPLQVHGRRPRRPRAPGRLRQQGPPEVPSPAAPRPYADLVPDLSAGLPHGRAARCRRPSRGRRRRPGARRLLHRLRPRPHRRASRRHRPPPPGSTNGRVFYLSPAGDDTNSGTSVASPWRTFGRVLNGEQAAPARATRSSSWTAPTRATTTGLPRIDCGSPGTASNGEAGEPITIRALNERQAHLAVRRPRGGVRDDGLLVVDRPGPPRAATRTTARLTQTDGFPFRFAQVSNVTGRRLLGSHNNREHNTHVFAVEVSQNVLLEECEAYYFHRHAFSIWRSRNVTLRRCYANSMLYGQQGCCSSIDNRDYGDEAISLYGTSDSIVENCISENQANGFQVHGISSPLDPSGHGGRNNRILGSISFDDAVPSLVESRVVGPNVPQRERQPVQGLPRASPHGNGLYFRGSARTTRVDNVTLYGSTRQFGPRRRRRRRTRRRRAAASLVCPATGSSCSSNSSCSQRRLHAQHRRAAASRRAASCR